MYWHNKGTNIMGVTNPPFKLDFILHPQDETYTWHQYPAKSLCLDR